MHVDAEAIQRFIHGELEPDIDTVVRQHLAGCVTCRAQYERDIREEEEIHALLRTIDHTPPALTAKEILRVERAEPEPRRGNRPLRIVAVIVLLAATAAAWTAPGSPLPGWADVALRRARDFAASLVTAIERAVEPAAPDTTGTGQDPPGPPITEPGL